MPICWLRKKILIVVAKWLFSIEADRPMNCEELSKPTPRLAGKMYKDSHPLIRPCHRSRMTIKLVMHKLAAATDMTLYRFVLHKTTSEDNEY